MLIEYALNELKQWSETFYEPIKSMPDKLKRTTTGFYLILRAIDEIEDHDSLTVNEKINLLNNISRALQSNNKLTIIKKLDYILGSYKTTLDPTTLKLNIWIELIPDEIAPRIFDGCSVMAIRMSYWVEKNWVILNEDDLNEYFFSVAGSLGLVLADIAIWHDGKNTNRVDAVGFGNYMQAINILRGRTEDLKRNVDFFPKGWSEEDVINYALKQKILAENFTNCLESGSFYDACCKLLKIADYGLSIISQTGKIERDSIKKP